MGRNDKGKTSHRPPSTTIEGQENRMISLAIELAEKQLRAGTASSQVITHFLKLGSTLFKLEKEKLEQENELTRAKTDAVKSQKGVEELYKQALNAMRTYSGNRGAEDDDA